MKQKINQKSQSLVSSIIWKLLERSSVQLITLATQIILARIVAPDRFGSLAIIMIFYNLAELLVQKGFGSALIRKERLNQEDINSSFVISMAISVLLCIFLFFLSPFVGIFYQDNTIVNPLRFLAINLLISPIYCIYNSLLIREMKFKIIFLRGLLAAVISGVVGILLAYLGFELWALVVQVVVRQIILTVVMLIDSDYKIGFSFSKKAFIEVFSFGKNVLITEFLLTFIESLRSLVIGKVYSKNELAYYDRGQMYPATLMRAIYDTLFSTLLPYLTKFQNNKELLKKNYVEITQVIMFFVFPVFFGFLSVSEEIVLILLTEKWSFSIPYMQLFCIYQAIFPFQITAKSVLYAIGDSKCVLKIELLKSFVSLFLMFVFIQLGSIYMVISLIITRIFSDIFYTEAVRIQLGNLSIFKKNFRIMFASILMVMILFLFEFCSFSVAFKLILKIIVGVLVYFISMIILDVSLVKKIGNLAFGYFGRDSK